METSRQMPLLVCFCAVHFACFSNAADTETNVNKPFSIVPYQPTYLLPFYYTSKASSFDKFEKSILKDSSEISVKFQISLKSPILRPNLNYDNTFVVGYTQQSYWQAYTDSPFLKTNDFQPELFWENSLKLNLPLEWYLQTVTPGVVHHSNGRGSALERSWNRIYVEAQFLNENWLIRVKPWLILPESSISFNPDIEDYLGNGSLLLSHKFENHLFAINTYAHIFKAPYRVSGYFTWSFPISNDVNGYVFLFSGYGQSLLEYNHRTHGLGLGIVFHDWMFPPPPSAPAKIYEGHSHGE